VFDLSKRQWGVVKPDASRDESGERVLERGSEPLPTS